MRREVVGGADAPVRPAGDDLEAGRVAAHDVRLMPRILSLVAPVAVEVGEPERADWVAMRATTLRRRPRRTGSVATELLESALRSSYCSSGGRHPPRSCTSRSPGEGRRTPPTSCGGSAARCSCRRRSCHAPSWHASDRAPRRSGRRDSGPAASRRRAASRAPAAAAATRTTVTERLLERPFGRTRGDAVDLWPPPRLRGTHVRRPQGPQR